MPGVSAGAGEGEDVPQLPREVAGRYEFVCSVGVGGEGRVYLLKDRQTGELAVLKMYHLPARSDFIVATEKLWGAALTEAQRAESRRHVVEILQWRNGEYGYWELQEYHPGGTLADLLATVPDRRLDPARLRDVIEQISGAVTFIHSLDIVHRDIKPENIFVRCLDPLDLVLGDFGGAKIQQFSTVRASGRASGAETWEYMPPEMHQEGVNGKPRDWWALGMVVYLAHTGRHALAEPDGRISTDILHLLKRIGNQEFTSEAVGDPRIKNLVDGLLTYNEANPRGYDRWSGVQVAAWLDASQEDPPVPRRRRRGQVEGGSPSSSFAVEGVDWPISEPEDLDRLLKERWEEAEALFQGRLHPEFRLWLHADPGRSALLTIATQAGVPFDGKSLRIQHAINPGDPLSVRGVALTEASLASMIAKARGDDQKASDWLQGLLDNRVLPAWAALRPSEISLAACNKLNTWREEARQLAAGLPREYQKYYLDNEAKVVPLLFEAALSDGPGITAGANIRRLPGRTDVRKQVLSIAQTAERLLDKTTLGGLGIQALIERVLAAEDPGAESIPLFCIARVVLLAPVKRQVEDQFKLEEDRRKAAEKEQRAHERAQRTAAINRARTAVKTARKDLTTTFQNCSQAAGPLEELTEAVTDLETRFHGSLAILDEQAAIVQAPVITQTEVQATATLETCEAIVRTFREVADAITSQIPQVLRARAVALLGDDEHWLILDTNTEARSALVISRNCVTQAPYASRSYRYPLWSVSSLAKWLNGKYRDSLPMLVREAILPWPADHSSPTTRKPARRTTTSSKGISLLDSTQAGRYFPDPKSRIACYEDAAVRWWIRPPGARETPTTVNRDGRFAAGHPPVTARHGVRPAFWLDLSRSVAELEAAAEAERQRQAAERAAQAAAEAER
ncbi:MAG: protein kinase family protein, partial [Bifidobacteriaceae bacterium]|nr:protein kinase family protein [Bifidobacteriaceae bacterium]